MPKYVRMKTIHTDIELLTAAITQAPVVVRDKDSGKLEDGGGSIEKYTPDFAKIGGTYYSRKEYVFTAKVIRK